MGNDVRPYDPRPPPASSLDPASYPLKLASLQVDPKQKGVKKYRIELPNDIRAKHLEDPVNGGTWRNLVLDFDRKFPVTIKSVLLMVSWWVLVGWLEKNKSSQKEPPETIVLSISQNKSSM